MIISNNIPGLKVLNKLKKNEKVSSKNIEKLSSGLRVNKSADDPAGLAISEKMKAQIRGLNQAQRNVQDGISLVQTAEGAATEIQDLQQRMRELCIQGANDTIVESDAASIQEELNALKEEIDNIAANTEFNTRKLLDGSLEAEPVIKTPLAFEWKVDFSLPKKLTAIISTSDGGMIVAGTSDKDSGHLQPNDRTAYLSKLDSQGNVVWEMNIPKDGEYNTVYDIKELNNGQEYILTTRSNYESGTVRYNKNIFYKVDAEGNILKKIDGGYNNYSFCINENSDGTFVETGSSGSGIFVRLYDSNLNSTKYKSLGLGSGHFRAGTDIKKTSDGGYIVVGQENHEDAEEYGLAIKLNADLTIAWETKIPEDAFSSVVQLEDGSFMVLGKDLYKFDASGNYSILNNDAGYNNEITETDNYIVETEDGNYLIGSGRGSASTENKVYKVDARGNEIWNIPMDNFNFYLVATAQLQSGDYAILGENQVFKYTSDRINAQDKGIYLQTGANQNDNMKININSMKTVDLGYPHGFPRVMSQVDAQLSLTYIDKAIDKVNTSRSGLGAVQNRLEHGLNNIGNYAENLTASESRIRDADMAKEMMDLSKNNILQQAAQAMLAQAKQAPEGVLQLLR